MTNLFLNMNRSSADTSSDVSAFACSSFVSVILSIAAAMLIFVISHVSTAALIRVLPVAVSVIILISILLAALIQKNFKYPAETVFRN